MHNLILFQNIALCFIGVGIGIAILCFLIYVRDVRVVEEPENFDNIEDANEYIKLRDILIGDDL